MKQLKLIVFLALINLGINAQSNLFYYSFDKKIYLTNVPDKYIGEFNVEKDSTFFSSRNVPSKFIDSKTFEVEGNFNIINTMGNGELILNPLYRTLNGTDVKMLNQIVLQWKTSTTPLQKTTLISQYNLVEIKTTRLFTIYRIVNPLFTSQYIYESGLVRYCHPVFLAKIDSFDISESENKDYIGPKNQYSNNLKPELNSTINQYFPNDEYFIHQWNLHNIGQECNDGNYGTPDADIDAPEAWTITRGNPNVVVAILDWGLTDNHSDLPNTRQIRVNGSNFLYSQPGLIAPYNDPNNPSPYLPNPLQYHGNSCAGVIGAEENNIGIIGVAPLCKIMPIRINRQTFETLAESITFAVDNGASIISASWGQETNDPNFSATMITAIEDAIQHNVSVVFASGNSANHSGIPITSNPASGYIDGSVAFPSNANIPNLITVGASDRNNHQSNYSATNENIDIVAPSSTDINIIPNEKGNIWSLDLPDDFGLNDYPTGVYLPSLSNLTTDYHKDITGRFGGTSAATPEVAGVVALMRSINPCLSVQQITNILYNTTDKVGGYNYNWSSNKPGHSKELGYGKLNAYNSVSIAQQSQSSTLDLCVKDTQNDFGIEPNTNSTYYWNSDDIWIRNLQDGVEEHQNPEYNPEIPNYVYVRVTNKSCVASLGNEILRTYWAKAGTGLSWPISWNNSTTFSNGASFGKEIGFVTIPILAPGQSIVLSIQWTNMPNPSDYSSINPEPWHFCLLSRIETVNDPMTFLETDDLVENVINNNNIAWKNVSIVDDIPNVTTSTSTYGAVVSVQNPFSETRDFSLELIKEESETGKPIYEESEVGVKMDNIIYHAWVKGGKESENLLNTIDEKKKLVNNNHVLIDNIRFDPKEIGTVYLSFNFLAKELTEKSKFTYHVIQRDKTTNKIIGGETYIIKKKPRALFVANAGSNIEIDKNQPITISAEQINEAAIYNWYDSDGNLIYVGKDLTVSSEITKKYRLEVVATKDGFKDYDEVEVKLTPSEIEGLSPNPASNSVSVKYKTNDTNSAYLMVIGYYFGGTITSNNYILDVNTTETNINIANYPPGIYTIALVCDGQIIDAKQLIKQ